VLDVKKSKVAVVAVVILFLFTLIVWNIAQFQAYASASFDVRISRFEINWFLFIPKGVTVYFTVEVYNPSFVNIYIPSIYGRVYLEDILIDDFYIGERRVPPGRSVSQTFSITVSVDDLPALGNALGSIISRGYATVRVDGDARIKLSLLPIIEIPYYITMHFSETRTISPAILIAEKYC